MFFPAQVAHDRQGGGGAQISFPFESVIVTFIVSSFFSASNACKCLSISVKKFGDGKPVAVQERSNQ